MCQEMDVGREAQDAFAQLRKRSPPGRGALQAEIVPVEVPQPRYPSEHR